MGFKIINSKYINKLLGAIMFVAPYVYGLKVLFTKGLDNEVQMYSGAEFASVMYTIAMTIALCVIFVVIFGKFTVYLFEEKEPFYTKEFWIKFTRGMVNQ